MTDKKLPKVIREEKINLMGLDLIVFHLDDGRRVIEQKSLENFFEKLGFCEE